VATLDIAVTGGQMPMTWAAEINFMAGAVGTGLALLLMVLIINRLIHLEALPAAMTPSLMILVAPFAVGFLAYSNIMGGIDHFAGLLFYFGLFMFAVVSPKIFRRSMPFTPGWWGISFPMAALVNAALKYAEFRNSAPLWVLSCVLLAALSLALVVLTVRTLRIVFNGKLFR
jgi:tellurite resistance protein